MKIYMVKKNADFTEGRGPMIIDSIWLSKDKASEYINTKTGIMGRKMDWLKYPDDWQLIEVDTMD